MATETKVLGQVISGQPRHAVRVVGFFGEPALQTHGIKNLPWLPTFGAVGFLRMRRRKPTA
jgi:hypothetical protein